MTGDESLNLVQDAYQTAVARLLAARGPEGFWLGELSSSALATATATSALATVSCERFGRLIEGGAAWLAAHQNPDGGWGDTTDSPSNLATTMLSCAALSLAGTERPAASEPALTRAEKWLTRNAGAPGDERIAAVCRFYGKDRTFAVPILMNCALAGMAPWKAIPRLPFELARIDHHWLRLMRIHVVSYALPALIAIGQLLHGRRPTLNPLLRLLRNYSIEPTLQKLQAIQPSTGGFIEAVPLTSFVVMSLAAAGRKGHPVTGKGVEFLRHTVRPDGSWPIDSNLSVWLTTHAVSALRGGPGGAAIDLQPTLKWILDCQQKEVHPFTQTAPGGWGWTHLAGGVPDADDTAGALLALSASDDAASRAAAEQGLKWLLGLQNADGGWPTFCRGWGKLPFDRSAADLTAHALRAIAAWWGRVDLPEMELAARHGFEYLNRVQQADGSWLPLWFGNQSAPGQESPVLGTGRVLTLSPRGGPEGAAAGQAIQFLRGAQNVDGGWGGAREMASTVEETAVAIEGLSGYLDDPVVDQACLRGSLWLAERIRGGALDRPSPVGLYFTKLWYYERLYPVIFSVAALGRFLAERQVRTSAASR
jgi:squalene-hopene/tetraprenyl-beta-curcumene cyclase